jgi:hypothetical protein
MADAHLRREESGLSGGHVIAHSPRIPPGLRRIGVGVENRFFTTPG